MDIKVIGAGCDKCDTLFENTKEAVKELSLDCEVKKIENLIEIVKLGVMSSPALMVDGKIYISGRSAKVKEIVKILEKL